MHPVPKRYCLYAEDDPDDQMLFKEIMAGVDPEIEVIFFGHGLDLIRFLEQLKPEDPLPVCIVLDVNMPVWDGIRTLTAIRKEERFAEITLIMFTTSVSQRDVELTKALGARDYIPKPFTRKDFTDVGNRLSRFVLSENNS